MTEVVGLFPTPLARVPSCIDDALVAALVERFRASARLANAKSGRLSHTEIFEPGSDELFRETARAIGPHLAGFGELLFGESLPWAIKEMWVNVLETGGHQAMHNHANSFASGVVYLTPSDPSSNTVFMKPPASHDFVFTNMHPGVTPGPFNSAKYVGTDPAPGDLVMFPSHLLHEVPLNRGTQRITLAFNAIPERLDAWGYSIRFSK